MTEGPIYLTWRPSLRVFVGRTAFVCSFTTIALSPGIFGQLALADSVFTLTLIFVGFFLSALFYALIFDEHVSWNHSRSDRWDLRATTLTFSSDLETGQIALHDIHRIRRWFWWGLRVRLNNGRSVPMQYLARTGDIRRAILLQREAVLS